MAEPDEQAVERRAKELAEQDGYTWQSEFKPIIPGAPIRPRRLLTEDRRKEYVALARAELREGSTHA